MESWTSIWTASPEVDLVSFDGAMVIFRVNGIPKMRDVERLLREAYEHGLCSAEEYRDYYRKHMASGMIRRNPFNSEKSKTELDKLIEKARWENEHSWFYRLFHRWKD